MESSSGTCGAMKRLITRRSSRWPKAFRVPLLATNGARFCLAGERPLLFDV